MSRSTSLLFVSAVFIGIFMTTHALGASSPPTGLRLVTLAGEIPPSFFGMTLINSAHWPDVPVGALGKGTMVGWIYIESSRGKYDWQNLDRWVELAQSRGITLFWSNSGVPAWAAADPSTCGPSYSGSPVQKCTSMITDIGDWEAFITALATRYKGKLIYELWNEPDNNSWTGSAADMVLLTSHMYQIIRSIDPAALIISPSGEAPYMDKFYAAGGVRTVDVVSLHGYPDPKDDVPESIGGFLSVPMKAVMAKYGLSQKPLWDTEGSWGKIVSGAITDPDLQAAFVARDYLLHWSNDISRFYWYAWDGGTWGALWDPGTGSHSAAAAYQQVYSWMVGAKMVGPCSMNGGTIYNAIYTCDLVRDGGYQARVVWNTSGDTKFVVPSTYTQYRDLGGLVHAVTTDRSITIGKKPILLEHLK
ncbi:MAG: cellulase family glycosylhydrolase [Syntrophobacteraceae bacterium]